MRVLVTIATVVGLSGIWLMLLQRTRSCTCAVRQPNAAECLALREYMQESYSPGIKESVCLGVLELQLRHSDYVFIDLCVLERGVWRTTRRLALSRPSVTSRPTDPHQMSVSIVLGCALVSVNTGVDANVLRAVGGMRSKVTFFGAPGDSERLLPSGNLFVGQLSLCDVQPVQVWASVEDGAQPKSNRDTSKDVSEANWAIFVSLETK